jgi:oligoendopeptidase F
MQISWLPKKVDDFLNWDWSRIEPIFQNLQHQELDDDNVLDWLEEWSEISKLLDESYWRLYDATTVNTSDETAEGKFTRFLDEIRPKAKSAEQGLKDKLLTSGINPPGYQVALRDFNAHAEIYREENQPLLSEEKKLVIDFDKIMGAQQVLWDGEQVPLPRLRKVYEEVDRDRREEAWRLSATRQLDDRQVLNDLYRKFLVLRQEIASNAGLPDYRAYRWQELLRFDYSPSDCYQFHEAIEKVVVPAALDVYENRRQRLGLSELRPWDLSVDPYGMPALKPFGTPDELLDRAETIFSTVAVKFGENFKGMRDAGMLDLENRANKAPGGYCTYYLSTGIPFIFMNAVGIHEDVQTLLHEGGHAFHLFECRQRPYFYLDIHSEIAEIASMAMELLCSPYLERDKGGFYDRGEAARARIQHLESMLLFWPYMAVVDAFQHWVYENPEAAQVTNNLDSCWARLWERFMPGVDWSGLEQEMVTGWQRKEHLFDVPFYYIEYGMAQLGSVQIFSNYLEDKEQAVTNYRHALSLGTSVTIPEFYQAAGTQFVFDEKSVRTAVSTILETINNLETMID